MISFTGKPQASVNYQKTRLQRLAVNRNTVQCFGFHVGEPLRRLAFLRLLKRAAVCLGLGETELRENCTVLSLTEETLHGCLS